MHSADLVMEFLDEIFYQSLTDNEQDFYQVLGCNQLSTTEQIITEYRLKAKQFHPDKNLNKSDTTEDFIKLQVAKDVLCDPKLRKEYDSWKQSGLQISFKRWLSMRDSLKVSMHWAIPVNKTPMIESNQSETNLSSGSSAASSKEDSTDDFAETLRKFRNYEI